MKADEQKLETKKNNGPRLFSPIGETRISVLDLPGSVIVPRLQFSFQIMQTF
jgi:hypothetical protein